MSNIEMNQRFTLKMVFIMMMRLYLMTDVSSAHPPLSVLETLYEWRHLNYAWNSEYTQEHYRKFKHFNYASLTPIDVDLAPDGRIFVTVIGNNIPASVNVVRRLAPNFEPVLAPYPNWSLYNNTDCFHGIKTVFRVHIDKCNRIWILDTGTINNKPTCPPKILVFDLKNDNLLQGFIIPENIVTNPSMGQCLLITPVVDYEPEDHQCQKPTVFMADVLGGGLVIMDSRSGQFYRVADPAFRPKEEFSHFLIAKEEFKLTDGLFGLALSPPSGNHPKSLYFRPLASRSLYATSPAGALSAGKGEALMYYSQENVLPSQATVLQFSKTGILFFGMTSEMGVGCWNPNSRGLLSQNMDLAVQDTVKLQFISGMKIVQGLDGREKLLMMSNRMQKVFAGTMDYENEVNFRITMADVETIITGKRCSFVIM